MLPTEWVLVAVIYTLGPYPVALKSYPDFEQCMIAVGATQQSPGRVRSECVRIVIPLGIKQ